MISKYPKNWIITLQTMQKRDQKKEGVVLYIKSLNTTQKSIYLEQQHFNKTIEICK